MWSMAILYIIMACYYHIYCNIFSNIQYKPRNSNNSDVYIWSRMSFLFMNFVYTSAHNIVSHYNSMPL